MSEDVNAILDGLDEDLRAVDATDRQPVANAQAKVSELRAKLGAGEYTPDGESSDGDSEDKGV